MHIRGTLQGNPLFFRPSSYTVYTEDGGAPATVDKTGIYYTLSSAGYMARSAYNDRIEGRGLHMDYPATYGAQTAPIGRRCIENAVSFLSLKDKLTGWNRTVWGFFEPGSDLPFTDGWYDVDEEKPDVDKMTPEEQKEYLEKEREEEKRESIPRTITRRDTPAWRTKRGRCTFYRYRGKADV